MYFYYCTHRCVCQLDTKENDDDDDDDDDDSMLGRRSSTPLTFQVG